MCSGLHIQQAVDECTRGSPPVSEGPRFVAASLPCIGTRACVQPPPAATGSQESQLLGRPCQLCTPFRRGPPTCPTRGRHQCSPAEEQRGNRGFAGHASEAEGTRISIPVMST